MPILVTGAAGFIGFHVSKRLLARGGGRPDERPLAELRPERVIHLAAQAGVRYSLINPHAYTDSNITGFLNILEDVAVRGEKIQRELGFVPAYDPRRGWADAVATLAVRSDPARP